MADREPSAERRARLTRPCPTSPSVHDQHDPLLVASLAAGDLAAADRDHAIAQTSSILRRVRHAPRRSPRDRPRDREPSHLAVARPRDFRLSPEQAAQLRPAGWRRFVARLRRAAARSFSKPARRRPGDDRHRRTADRAAPSIQLGGLGGSRRRGVPQRRCRRPQPGTQPGAVEHPRPKASAGARPARRRPGAPAAAWPSRLVRERRLDAMASEPTRNVAVPADRRRRRPPRRGSPAVANPGAQAAARHRSPSRLRHRHRSPPRRRAIRPRDRLVDPARGRRAGAARCGRSAGGLAAG